MRGTRAYRDRRTKVRGRWRSLPPFYVAQPPEGGMDWGWTQDGRRAIDLTAAQRDQLVADHPHDAIGFY